jgi:hypothetical protein
VNEKRYEWKINIGEICDKLRVEVGHKEFSWQGCAIKHSTMVATNFITNENGVWGKL